MSNHEKGIAPLEKFLFDFARLVALIGAVAAIGGIVFCGLFLMGKFDKPTTISYEELVDFKNTARMTSYKYKLSKNLEQSFGKNNKAILDDWLKRLDSDEQREDFLGNMSEVVAEAVSRGIDQGSENLSDAINTYKELKFKKLSQSLREQSEFGKYASAAAKWAAIAAILGLVVLLLLVSLMLVLLVIERHVRIATTASPMQPT